VRPRHKGTLGYIVFPSPGVGVEPVRAADEPGLGDSGPQEDAVGDLDAVAGRKTMAGEEPAASQPRSGPSGP
jgi:hypothetical protein